MNGEVFAAAAGLLRSVGNPDLQIDLATDYETLKPYAALDDKEKKNFATKLAKSVTDGLASNKKDSLLGYLQVSARGREKFSAVSRIAVELSPPSKLKTSTQDFHAVWDSAGTLTLIVNQKSVIEGKMSEGFGPAIDLAMQLCALTDGYMDKAKLAIGQTMSAAAQMCPPLRFEMDWAFVDSANYVKLAEDARSTVVSTAAGLVKSGMLEKKDGLACHLQRSARATAAFAAEVQTVMLSIDPDNRCKAPYELTDGGAGVLKVLVRLNALDKAAAGWGPAADERLALRVVDEEGMRAAQNACDQYAQHLPQGTRIDVDWSFTLVDKWRKMKPDERASALASIAKKTIMTGATDKREGLAGLFAKSNRARQIFTEKVGVVQLRVEMAGAPKPMLLEGGVLSVPCLLTALDESQPWGTLADTALGLRVQDEVELRKMEAAIEKTGCAGLPVMVDWASFLDEPNLLRQPADKRLGVAQTMLSMIQAGIGGRQGLGSHGAALTGEVDRIQVRASAQVKAKTGVELRYGSDRILEVTIKTQALTAANADSSSWLPLFTAAKNDGGTATPFQWPYSLLVEADGNTMCQVQSPPPQPNALLEADGVAPSAYHSAPSLNIATPTASAPPMKDVKAVSALLKVAAPPPAAKVAPPPAAKAAPPKASPPPVRATATAPPVKAAAAIAAAPVPSADGVPGEFGCPATWKIVCDSMTAINRACGSGAVAVIDWSFLEAPQFASQPDAQKKQIVSNIGVRAFQPLDKEMAKLAKRHALYLQSVNLLTEVRFAYDCAEGVMDASSGKAGKTHYAVAVENGGAILSIRLNLSQHMAGIIPVLEGKLLVAYGVQHVVALQEAETLISQRGEKAKLTCFLDTNSFGTHDAFLKQPITMDSITWWAQVAKEADTALGKLLQALEIACKDPIFSAAFKARFSSILVQPDPASQVRDITAPSTWTMQDNAEQFQLVFRYNLNDGAQAGQAAAVKLASFVDVRLAQAVEAARKDAQEQLMKFRPTVQGTELTLTDFFPALSALKLDKGIEACKVLKTWLAGMTRQLGLIVQRNPTVFKTKVRGIVFGLDPANGSKGGVDCIVGYDRDTCVLTIVQNLDSANKPDATVSQRVDGLLDVTMVNLQGEVTVEMQQRSQSLSNALRIPGLAVNLDFSFERDPAFEKEAPQAKAAKVKRMRGHVEATLDALIKCGAEAAVGLVAVLVGCDGSNSTSDPLTGATDAEHYIVVLDKDGLLRVTLNLDSVERPLGRLHHKVEQQLALHRARQNTAYHGGREYFDWESLQSCAALLNDTILTHFESSLNLCRDSVVTFAESIKISQTQSPAGREAIAPLQTVYVRMDRDQGEPWVVIQPNATTLVLSLSLEFVKEKHRVEELKWKEALEWTLGSTVEVEKYHAEKTHAQGRSAKAEETLKKAFGSPIQIEYDWATYVDSSEFLEMGADACRNTIRRLSTKLLNAVVEGMTAIAKHPVGKKALGSRTKKVIISWGPRVDITQRLRQPCKVSVNGETMIISFRALDSSCEIEYKSRIEFELGIVVDVAEYDATARRDAVSAVLGKLPVTYDLLGFQNTDEFRFGIDIANQPSIVDAVVAGVAEHVWANKKDGLASVWDRAQKVVKKVLVELSVKGDITGEYGRLQLRGDTLALTLDLGGVLQISDSRNLRPRIASVCGFLDELSRVEANAKLAQTDALLKLCPVQIDWAFLEAPQWKALPAADRYERVHNLGGELARASLLGYWGLPGLTSFAGCRTEFLNRVKLIALAVDAAAAKGTYRTELNGTTLRLVFPLDEVRLWSSSNSQGCRTRVETTMQLRKLTESQAIEEQNAVIAAVAAQLRGKKVTLAWDKLLASADYLAERDYVAYIRYVGGFVGPLLLGYGQRAEGLLWAGAQIPQVAEFLGPIQSVEIEVDGDCKTKPPQERFVNGNISCVKKGATLLLTVRRDWMEVKTNYNGMESPPSENQLHCGCGTVVAAALSPGEFKAREANHLERYKAQLISIEESRRASLIEDWQSTCERNIREYNDDMQDYARAGTQSCGSCGGKGYWGVHNNHLCSTCKGTRMRQASMRCPSMPINPPQPIFPSMATIDFMGIGKSETSFSHCAKIAFSTEEAPVPAAPVFTDVPSGTRWSKSPAVSLGAEDTRPPGSSNTPIKGWKPYVPAKVSDDPMSDGDGKGDAPSAPKAPIANKAAAAAAAAAAARGGGKAQPPPAKKK